MAEEKEASFPISSFGGINRNVDREEIQGNQFYQLQNLWERKLGTLETRNGSAWVNHSFDSGGGAGITGLDNIHKIYKPVGENPRLVVGTSLQPVAGYFAAASIPNLALSFVNDAAGWWNKDHTFSATTYSFSHEYIIIRLVGPGTEEVYRYPVSGISGLSAGTNQKLRVAITGAIPGLSGKVTGIEVLAVIHCGTTNTPSLPTSVGSAYNYRTMWVGYINTNGVTSLTTDFLYAPYGNHASMTHPITIGSTTGVNMGFTVQSINGNGGSLTAGKTYYIMVLPQFGRFGTDPRASYLASKVNIDGGQVVPITVPTGLLSTGTIYVTMGSFLAVTYMVAIGETPQTLQPIGIFNDSVSTVPQVTINTVPEGNPAVIVANKTNSTSSATQADMAFNFSNYSRYDCLMKIKDDNSYVPVFTANMYSLEGGEWDTWYDQFGSGSSTTDTGSGRQYVQELVTGAYTSLEKMGVGNRYNFVPWQATALFVNNSSQVGNYFMTDGTVAVPVIMDFQSQTLANRRTLPNSHYIGLFQGSILLGGGVPGIDPTNGGKLDSSRSFYVSRAGNYSDFTIAGAATPILNFLSVDAGEDLNGFGSFTNTQNQLGPLSQGLITNKNGIWVIDELPSFGTSGEITNINSINLRILSKKVGCAGQNVICYSPVGTIIASNIGVWVVRDGGEPTPIGQCLMDILREAKLDLASACFHDNHYKLSFYHRDYDTSGGPIPVPPPNNCEFWLNINKMMETKGKEDWVGPMIGPGIQYSFVEDRDKDGLTYSVARNRYCTGGYAPNGPIYSVDFGVFKADIEPALTDTVVNDFGVPVVSIMETSELVTPQDQNWNKLIKRWYWKVRTNLKAAAPLSFIDKTYVEAVLQETQTITTSTPITDSFKNIPFTAVRVFPLSRLRGRTFRKVFQTSSRVALNGFQFNYEVERRRI